MSQTTLKPHFTPPGTFSEYFENQIQNPATSNITPDTLRKVTDSEIVHYDHIFRQRMLQDCDEFNQNKKPHIHLLLYQLGRHVRQIDDSKKACLR